MVILLYGPDTFRSQEKLRELKKKFLRNVEGGSLNLKELDGEKITFADFKKEISTVSFLAKKRMVILKNLISKSKNKDLQKDIISYLKNYDMQDNILLFWEEEKNEKELLAKFLTDGYKKTAKKSEQNFIYKQEFELLKGLNLKNWIIKSVKEKGGAINASAVTMLMERIASDLWQMDNELEKLVSYDKNITEENIRKFVKTRDDENIFNLTDAIGSKNRKLALKLLSEQLRAGVNINYIITMLARQFKLLLEVKDHKNKFSGYVSAQALSRDLKIHSFVASKLLAQEKLYSMETLKNIYSQILDIDFKSKTTSLDIELLLDVLIVKN